MALVTHSEGAIFRAKVLPAAAGLLFPNRIACAKRIVTTYDVWVVRHPCRKARAAVEILGELLPSRRQLSGI
jgi:hypothetical protein